MKIISVVDQYSIGKCSIMSKRIFGFPNFFMSENQASTDTDIYRPVPKLFKYRYQYRWPIFIKTIGLCFYIVVEDGV